MENNGNEEGDEIAASGHREGQSDKHRVKNDTRLENGNTELLGRGSSRLNVGDGRVVVVVAMCIDGSLSSFFGMFIAVRVFNYGESFVSHPVSGEISRCSKFDKKNTEYGGH